MGRIATFEKKEPLRLSRDELEGDAWICQCGLTGNAPFCDGAHTAARDEEDGVTYRYERQGGEWVRTEVGSETEA